MSSLKDRLNYILEHFNVEGTVVSYLKLTSGHINDTYKITTEKASYILQKINGFVFKDGAELINNKAKISKFLLEQEQNNTSNTLSFVQTKEGENYYKDEKEDFWNLSYYIEGSKTYTKTPNERVASEAGRITGNFLYDTRNFDSKKLTPIFSNFHTMSFRVKNFEKALQNANADRLEQAQNTIAFYESTKQMMYNLEKAIEQKDLALRVTHSDTKMSNILFAEDDEGICMIDTDTVMEGILHYDYGDAIRTICNNANEDEKDLDKVSFNLSFFKAYTQGFFQGLRGSMTSKEAQYLSGSIFEMIFIMGLRFLTDYLCGDVYYKVTHKTHNLERAENQMKLFVDAQKKSAEIDGFIQDLRA